MLLSEYTFFFLFKLIYTISRNDPLKRMLVFQSLLDSIRHDSSYFHGMLISEDLLCDDM